jgi:hypothetical protein
MVKNLPSRDKNIADVFSSPKEGVNLEKRSPIT